MAHLIDDPICAEVCAWLAADADRLIETHCAWVVLKGDLAFKLKRPVDLGYLDFSTREKRRWALERELEFNRATAPTIYRALRTITRKAHGGLEMDGPGEVLEWALEMRRFDDGSVLSLQPDKVQGDLAERLGRVVAGLHRAAEVKPQGAGTAALGYTITSNAEHLRHLAPVLGAEAVEVLVEATDQAFAKQSALLNARQALGLGRRCHGDLHLGNIFIENDEPVAFDCIEFNDQLSDIDIQYDIAFLLMDLLFRGNRAGAVRVLSGYLDEAARSFGPAVFEGLAALPLMLSVRAAVRAHVSAQMGQAELARAAEAVRSAASCCSSVRLDQLLRPSARRSWSCRALSSGWVRATASRLVRLAQGRVSLRAFRVHRSTGCRSITLRAAKRMKRSG